MKKAKKYLSVLLSLTFLATGLTACSGSKSSSDTKSGSPDEIVYSFVTFNKVSEDLAPVEKAINDITVPKINVKVKLKPLSIANYSQQINLSMQSGEQLDVFHTLGDLSQLVNKNEVLPMDDLISKYGAETKQIVGDDFLKTNQFNGKTYAIPAYKGFAFAPDLVYRTDILKELGISPDSIKSVKDLDAVFAKVKEKYPNMIPIAPANQGSLGLTMTVQNVDFLYDDYTKPMTVSIGDSLKVVDFYETDEFKEVVNTARDWYNKGYIQKDAASSSSLAGELMGADRCFSYIASYAGKESGAQISALTGKPISMLRLGQPYLSTSNINGISWAISATSKKPEAAMKFLNLTYSNKDVVNLIIYGVEGQDYVKVDADHVKYPEGKDPNTVPYTAQLSCGIVGNQFIQYSMENQSTADLKLMESENKNAKRSKAFGFIFDNSPIKNEVSSVANVVNQYMPGLSCGSLNPEKELPDFIKKLKEAGIDNIVKEKQKQLDDWSKKQK